VRAIGVDRDQPGSVADGLVFHRGDIRALPYLNSSFPVVSCIDVIEHRPGWLTEHQGQSYPVTSQIVRDIQEAAFESGRVARISLSYCDPASVCRLVRSAAARSDVLYIAANLVLGALFSFLRPPDADNSPG
jgi:hypothetical protein